MITLTLEMRSLMLYMLGKIFSRRHFEILFFFLFSQEIGFGISCKLSSEETICMKCQNLFSFLCKLRKISSVYHLLNLPRFWYTVANAWTSLCFVFVVVVVVVFFFFLFFFFFFLFFFFLFCFFCFCFVFFVFFFVFFVVLFCLFFFFACVCVFVCFVVVLFYGKTREIVIENYVV